jgi:23S rRNA G2445 N2-methylase RlmL
MITIAQKNAQQAGVDDTIVFEKKEFSSNVSYE